MNYINWKIKRKYLFFFLLLLPQFMTTTTEACSSRSTPKPRLPPNQSSSTTVVRPNITIQTFTCPPEYNELYCLNGANCFTIKIGPNILYNCECSDGYMGQRCEFKDLDGSYIPSRRRELLEQAGITSTVVILILFIIFLIVYFSTSSGASKFTNNPSYHPIQISRRQPFTSYQSI